jgi:hypothetical protein
MRNSMNKSMIAIAALTIGFAVAGVSVSASANPSTNVSSTMSSMGSNNTLNPLMPDARSNSGYLGATSQANNSVGSIDLSAPIAPVGQIEVNCHLLTNYKRTFCD